MSFPDANSTLKRLRNRYRLMLINEDTYEEVLTFQLTRVSVYIAFSVLFVLLVGLTVALIAFTPLKLYIPGYGSAKQAKEYQVLKVKADSIEQALVLKQQYIDNIENIFKGQVLAKDTTMLKIKEGGKSTY
jgi:hypothetical protein